MKNEDDIIVDIYNWLNFLDILHENYPDIYNNPDDALIGFEQDWNQYQEILKRIKNVQR